jgi:hypothetical protein
MQSRHQLKYTINGWWMGQVMKYRHQFHYTEVIGTEASASHDILEGLCGLEAAERRPIQGLRKARYHHGDGTFW